MGSAFRSSSLLRVANAVAVTRQYGDGNTPTLRTESVSLSCAAIQQRRHGGKDWTRSLTRTPLSRLEPSRTEIAWERYPNWSQVHGGSALELKNKYNVLEEGKNASAEMGRSGVYWTQVRVEAKKKGGAGKRATHSGDILRLSSMVWPSV
ncbi:hypothetical protein BGY98DRAFT_146835 [Russula aff. rugulosa BPL654]|nr:hypothetical protein BGY98DRAFT_146835 [Russula aff. rugulosa BPL654]